MFDTAEGTLPGGNAKAFDWTFLSGRSRAGALVPGRRAHSRQCCRGRAGHRRARLSMFPLASKRVAV